MAKSVQKGITAVPGIRVGHTTDLTGLTGCTVVLCEKGAVGGVDQRGGAPGTRASGDRVQNWLGGARGSAGPPSSA